MANAWLTPDTAPGPIAARCLLIPDSTDWLAIVSGALLPLIFPYNFEQYGTSTPEETAAVFRTMFDNFSFNTGVCRVIGEIVCTAGPDNPNPDNWLRCDHEPYLIADYPELYAVIGASYGQDTVDDFKVPGLLGRVIVGADDGAHPLTENGGEEEHVLTISEMPSHNHYDGIAVTTVIPAGPLPPLPSAIPGASGTGLTGGDGPHNNMQPWIALNYWIVAR